MRPISRTTANILAGDTTMSEDKKRKRSKDGVEKKHKKAKKKDKRDTHGNKHDKQLKTAEAAFSLLADDKTANPALAALFAAKV